MPLISIHERAGTEGGPNAEPSLTIYGQRGVAYIEPRVQPQQRSRGNGGQGDGDLFGP
jgi:hypothetical protein